MVIGVALFEGAEELDWAGPWEVLAAWAQQWPDDGVRVFTLAREEGTITCAKGLRVVPDQTWESAPPLDVLVYPGGRGTRRELADEAVLDWVRGIAGSGAVVDQRLHRLARPRRGRAARRQAGDDALASLELLPTLGREIEVRPDDRFVDTGEVITAAGRLGRDRHGPAPRRAPAFARARARGAPLHPVRPRAAGLSRRRLAAPRERRQPSRRVEQVPDEREGEQCDDQCAEEQASAHRQTAAGTAVAGAGVYVAW